MAFLDNTGLERLWQHIVALSETKLNDDEETINMLVEAVLARINNANGVSF